MTNGSQAFVFRLNDHGEGPELIREVFLEKGWQEFEEDEREDHEWNLWWRTSRFRTCEYDQVQSWQRLNHYPKSTAITRKDTLARNLKRMKAVYGASAYNFSPVAFNLPNDYTRFVAEYTRLKDKAPNQNCYWICKPADLSRGRGIFIFKQLSELQYDCNAVVQQYITNPLLISGYKFDLRIYVAVTSFHPLNIYIYNEGLVRFSTEKFDLMSLHNLFSHLTNTSINKHSPSYTNDKERVGPGCKWTLSQLRSYIQQANMNDKLVFARIVNIIILTIAIQAPLVPKSNNCFEVYGFDILIDENLKPWLLEVNFSPALSSDCQVDIVVKKPLLYDLIDLLRFVETDKDMGGPTYRNKRTMSGYSQNQRYAIGGNKKRQTAVLVRRSTTSKLPDIQSHVNPVCNEEGDESDSLMSDEAEEEKDVVLPGCGLPSVQQYRVSNRRSRSSVSDSLTRRGLRSSFPKTSVSEQKQHIPTSLGQTELIKTTGQSKKMISPVMSDQCNKKGSVHSVGSFSNHSSSSDASAETVDDHNNKISVGFKRVVRAQDTAQRYSPKYSQTKLYANRPRVGETATSSSFPKYCDDTKGKKTVTSQATVSSLSAVQTKRLKVTHQAKSQHDKPWRSRPALFNPRKSASTPIPQKVGGFVLVFPFSESTQRCSSSDNFDVKKIILECQRYLKELPSIDTSLNQSDFDDQANVIPGIPNIWL